jgi:amino acid transporter
MSQPEAPALRRTLGTRDITVFAIACIVGTRWIASAAHAGPGAILLWIVGAVCFSVPLAIAVAALTVRHPHAGGMYVWTRHDFGPWHGFLCFWLYWMSIIVWFPGAAMFYVGTAAAIAGSQLADNRTWLIAASLAVIWVALGANILGVKTGQRTADFGAIGAWFLAALLCTAAIVFLRHHPSATSFHILPTPDWDTVSFWSTIAFAMSGIELVGLMGAEVRDPKRSLPKAAWISSLFTTLFYAGATAAVLVMLRPDQVSELQGLSQSAMAAAAALGASWLPPVIALLVIATAVGQFGGLGSSVSRMPFAAGVDGLLPEAFGKIHPRWNTPHVSILTLGALASALLLLMQIGDTARAAYDTLVSLMVIVGFIPFIYIFGSAWKAGHRWSAASGWCVTLLAILCVVVPPGGITNVLVFEAKLVIGTAAAIASAWVILWGRRFRLPSSDPKLPPQRSR